MTRPPTTLPAVTEKQFMCQVVDMARLFNWHVYHPFLSIHSARGWPDLAICRPPRLILAELKSETGKLTVDQHRWLELLAACPGVETFVWRPSDLEQIATILR